MNLEIQSLRRAEAATLRLRGLYESYGYRKYRMGRFEEYSLYVANKSFLLGENVPTFTDLDGRLMALKPDVTLSIAKNTLESLAGSNKNGAPCGNPSQSCLPESTTWSTNANPSLHL